MADEDKKPRMIPLLVKSKIILHRPKDKPGKAVDPDMSKPETVGSNAQGLQRIIPAIGRIFHFTEQEARDIHASNPNALRRPVNEAKDPATAAPEPAPYQGGGAGGGRIGKAQGDNATGVLDETRVQRDMVGGTDPETGNPVAKPATPGDPTKNVSADELVKGDDASSKLDDLDDL